MAADPLPPLAVPAPVVDHPIDHLHHRPARGPVHRRRAVLAAILALPLSAAAQEAGAPVLVIDQDRVFEEHD